MAISNFEESIKYDVERALYQPIANGLSVFEWAKIGMNRPRWISAKDRLPEENTDVLLKFDNTFAVGGRDDYYWYVSCGNDWYTTLDEGEAKPTHWMPLPEPPKEGEVG